MRKTKTGILRKLIAHLQHEVTEHTRTPEYTPAKSYSRRHFIADTAKGAVGAGLVLSLPALATSCKNESPHANTLDLAILGAGIAGLNCANHLLSSNLNFKIYEASKRAGGRILTHYNDSLGLGIFPEFGGDFIDSNHSDMLDLASEFNLERIDLEEEQQSNKLIKDIYYFDNRVIPEEKIIKEFKKIAGQIADDVGSLGENYDTPEAVTLDNTALSDYIASLPCAPWLKDLFTAAFVAEYGLDCTEQSAINLLDLIDTDTSAGFKVFGDSDERYRIKGGNAKIIEGLVKKIGQDRIHYNHIVTDINENEQGFYQIKFADGKEILARTIVCTIPFTILRNLKLKLKNMSAEKRKCIDELGYGMNTKLILGYSGTPWRDKPNSAMGYLFHKDLVNGWDGGVNKTPDNQNGAYVGYFGGQYSMNLVKESFKNPLAPPTHSWNTGLPEQKVTYFADELDRIFVNSKKKFLNKHVFVNWIDFPYAKCSYSCYTKGQWTTLSGLEMEPVGNFFFAGEHCSTEFQGFMNGAAETGRRVATHVLEKIKVTTTN